MIDILTKYGVKKRTAQAAKTMKHGANAEISTVKPEQYARRFLDFVSKCIEWPPIPKHVLSYCIHIFIYLFGKDNVRLQNRDHLSNYKLKN